MKFRVFAAAVALLVTGSASAVTIGFDDLAGGVAVSTQYQTLGAVFSATSSGGASASAMTFADPAEATSGANILVGDNNFGDLFLSFVDPITGLPATADDVSVNAISVGWAEWTATARNSAGSQIEQFILSHKGVLDSLGSTVGYKNVDLIEFTSDGIALIDFVFTKNSVHSGLQYSDGIGIDDLTFTLASGNDAPGGIPEPGTCMLAAFALPALWAIRRKRRMG